MSARAAVPVILLADLAARHRPVGAVGWTRKICNECRVLYPCEVIRAVREGLVELDADDPPAHTT